MVRGGEFLVTDRSANGNAGGEVTLRLKRIGNHVPKLVGGSLVLGAPTFARPISSYLDIQNADTFDRVFPPACGIGKDGAPRAQVLRYL